MDAYLRRILRGALEQERLYEAALLVRDRKNMLFQGALGFVCLLAFVLLPLCGAAQALC